MVDEGGLVKPGAREMVAVVGGAVCAWIPGTVRGAEECCGVVAVVAVAAAVLVVLAVLALLGSVLAVVGALTVGADVRGRAAGGSAGGGGCMNWRLSGGSGSEALTRL